MDSLTLSTPLSHHSPAALRFSSDQKTQSTAAAYLHTRKPFTRSLKCSLSAFHQQIVNSAASLEAPLLHVSASSPQTPATAMRGAEADVMGLLLQERIVFLGTGIDDFVADAIVSQLLLLDAKDSTKDIRLFINSPGGSVSATMAIFDVLRLVRADVSTIALGVSTSTASIILGGGTKGKRFAMPNTRIMIHQPLGVINGYAKAVEVQAKELKHNKENIIRIISEFSGRSSEQVEKDISKDRFMTPIEAIEYGIIDDIINRESIIPLEPTPEEVKSSVFNEEEFSKDPMKFLKPEIPDDEIY